jgi:hypothetical protein
MNTVMTPAPDLLRRFVSTPHASRHQVHDTCVYLETNDVELAMTMRANFNSSAEHDSFPSILWKLIRDDEAPCGGREVTILSSGPMSTLLIGPGTVICIDRQQHEVLGFLSANISASEFVNVVMPTILRLSVDPQEMIAVDTRTQ